MNVSKWRTTLLPILSVLTLAACGNNDDGTQNSAGSSSSISSSASSSSTTSSASSVSSSSSSSSADSSSSVASSVSSSSSSSSVSVTTPAQIVINEVRSTGDYDYVELYNSGATAYTFETDMWSVKDDDDTHSFAIPGGTTIQAGGFLLLLTNETALPSGAPTDALLASAGNDFGLGKGDMARLYYNGVLNDEYTIAAGVHADTDGRYPDGSATWKSGLAATPGSANAETAGSSSSSASSVAFAASELYFASRDNVIDLANYRVSGRYSLPEPNATTPNLLAQEASGVTYDKNTDTLFVVGDGGTAVVQVAKDGTLIDSMTLEEDASKPQGTAFYDPEGIAYLGGGRFVLVEERYRQVSRFTYTAGGSLGTADVQTVVLGTTIGNIGIEGISYDPYSGDFIGVKEADPEGVFLTGIDFDAGTATNGSATTENSVNMFDPAKAGLSTMNDVYALSNVLPSSAPDYEQLLILSAPDGMVVKIDRSGVVQSSLDVGADAQNEGIAVDGDYNVYTVNEVGGGDGHPQMFVFASACPAPAVGNDLCLAFTRDVAAGTGDIVIDNGAGDKRTVAVTDANVSFAGDTMTVRLADLTPGTTYAVTYDAGVIQDLSGNPAPAVADHSLRFNTSGVVDTTAPDLNNTIPSDDTVNFSGGAVILTFDEPVISGTGNIIITDDLNNQTFIDVTDTTQVRFGGKSVVITPSTTFGLGRSYNVQMASGVITDLAGNDFAGLNDATQLNFTTAMPAEARLLVTEVNSKATGGDFYELYNYGATAIDLTGWKYNDSAADLSTAVAFPDGTVIEAGGLLLVHVGKETTEEFLTAWGLDANVSAITLSSEAPTDAPKLGGGDAVVIFDDGGAIAAAFNYTGAALGGIEVAARTDGQTMPVGEHAGPSVGGGASEVSAVWDGASTAHPTYRAATAGDNGFVAQGDDSNATPGAIPLQDESKLLISEVNSNSEGGDFFELYNFGTASIDVSGWVYDDDSASVNAGTAFPAHIVIPAGERLIVNVKASTEAFKSIWNITVPGSYVLLETGSGLSKGDAVVLFNAEGGFVTGMNYGMSALPVLDANATQIGTLDPAKDASGNIPTVTAHAGPAFGGVTDGTSAVWDGLSTSDPRYGAAVIGVAGAFSPDGNVSIGSPGK